VEIVENSWLKNKKRVLCRKKIGDLAMHRNQKNKKWSYMMLVRCLFGGVVLLCSLGLARADTAWPEKQKLLPSDGAADERFGSTVSTSGDYAILGAPLDNDKGIRSGSACCYLRRLRNRRVVSR
jgi:hypothetical protein